MVVQSGTTAQMVLPGNQTQSLTSAHVRATEYTVGTNGPLAMPATLPATSGYTYAVALTIDEAQQANASQVSFSTPVAVYLENFLNEAVGVIMPAGYYDKQAHIWVPSTDGRVIKILSTSGGSTTLDVDGSGSAATSTELKSPSGSPTTNSPKSLRSTPSVRRSGAFPFSTFPTGTSTRATDRGWSPRPERQCRSRRRRR